jgi:transposase
MLAFMGRRVFACTTPTDLRKGFDGLAGLVDQRLGRSATSGDLYLFVSRDRMRAKVLLWDGTGLCVYAKRLEQGRFAALWGRVRDGQVELTSSELALFLEGSREVGRQPLSPPPVNLTQAIAFGAQYKARDVLI